MSELYYNVSTMQIKLHAPAVKTGQKEIQNSEKDPSLQTDKNTEKRSEKETEKGSVSLSVTARKSYEESLKEAEESVPVLVKLLKAQLARLQQRLVDIKQEVDQIKQNDQLDEEAKNTMLVAKQDEIANVMSAIQTVNAGLLETMEAFA